MSQKTAIVIGEDVVSNMVGLITRFIVKFVDNYTIELEIIYNKILALETKEMKSKLPKITVLSTSAPAPPPQIRPIGNENVREVILGELKDLFNKKGVKDERI